VDIESDNKSEKLVDVLVVGGGAAGYFAALRAKLVSPESSVTILERGSKVLQKVSVSGGGRCNVTHSCFDPANLVKFYPRGGKELRGAFSRFQPQDTVEWFTTRGVELKTEADGRMFPDTDSSQTIIDCLEAERVKLGVELLREAKIASLSRASDRFDCQVEVGGALLKVSAGAVVFATGSNAQARDLIAGLNHTITPCAPSLFTFEINNRRLIALSGVSVSRAKLSLEVKVENGGETHLKRFSEQGPVLITHWGLSGPAVIRLSAWAARELAASSYKAKLAVNWLGVEGTTKGTEKLQSIFNEMRAVQGKQLVVSAPPVNLPKRLWVYLVGEAGISEASQWASLKKEEQQRLAELVTGELVEVIGKGVFKEEFVTCGGVSLKEVDFRTMQSKLHPGLFFAGEILDIDGLTGGFNFQNAWTTGWIAGESAGSCASECE